MTRSRDGNFQQACPDGLHRSAVAAGRITARIGAVVSRAVDPAHHSCAGGIEHERYDPRVVGQRRGAVLGQPVVMDNRVGASGQISTELGHALDPGSGKGLGHSRR